jgi:hypothetical protein
MEGGGVCLNFLRSQITLTRVRKMTRISIDAYVYSQYYSAQELRKSAGFHAYSTYLS